MSRDKQKVCISRILELLLEPLPSPRGNINVERIKRAQLAFQIIRILAVLIRVTRTRSSIAVLASESRRVDEDCLDFDTRAGGVFSREEKIGMSPTAGTMRRVFNL
jgi:hypothetical protein